MLVRITDSCRMGCKHCMINSKPDSGHMSVETFHKAIEFIDGVGEGIIMMSGGEPTDHPQFFEIADIAKKSGLMPLIMSNGMFLEDNEIRDKVLGLGIPLQITNDERYYPKKIFEYKHPLISWESWIRLVSPFGRALENRIPVTRQSPLCFNLRSVVRAKRDLADGIRYLRLKGKFCTPSINIDGSIVAGESNSCCKIGEVGDSLAKVMDGILGMECNLCGLAENLEAKYKAAIGIQTN